jgi:putative photosynthetic complex assembly protein 2
MYEYALPLLYALVVWWLTTGVLLYLHRLPARTYRWSMLGMTVAAGGALYGQVLSSGQTDVSGAYVAFTCGVVLWGWLELAYFTGFLVGPRGDPCPEGCNDWRRFRLAVRTSLFHEAGILTTAALLMAIAWDCPNQVGTWSFVVLWLMRWSAKLNLFLGVPNLNEHWLPEHMRFLSTYMVKRPMNLLFPVSVTGATVVLGLLVLVATATETAGFQRVGLMLVASLLALGILEHWFLVLPLPEEALWRWALRAPGTNALGTEVIGGERAGPGDELSGERVAREQEAFSGPSPQGCSLQYGGVVAKARSASQPLVSRKHSGVVL